MKILKFLANILIFLTTYPTFLYAKTKHGGVFWQLTDIHWDLEYSEYGNKFEMCHNFSERSTKKPLGHYGDYLCDSPYPLVYSAIQTMKRIEPHPDFILWTGDNAPHTEDSNFPTIFKIINNVTNELVSVFDSNIPLIPVLGNHDSFPQNEYPPSGISFYERYLVDGNWREVIPVEAQNDFRKAGYYKAHLPSDVDVLVLNTNLYYRFNQKGEGLADPGDQFEWMKRSLQEARENERKVFITGHIPPGFWERNPEASFLNDTYNDYYVDILNDYGDIIVAQIYGHAHTDSFRVFKNSDGDLRSVGFLAPSLTPWFPTLLEGGTAINPSLRLYTFNSSSELDYVQYQLNLTEANRLSLLEDTPWREYYRATSVFGVSSLNVSQLASVPAKFMANDSLFQDYFLINSAGIEHGYCNDTCKRIHLCAMTQMKRDSFTRCLTCAPDTLFNTPLFPALCVSYSSAIIASAVSLAIILGTMVVAILVWRRKIVASAEKVAEFDWGKRQAGYKPLSSVEEEA